MPDVTKMLADTRQFRDKLDVRQKATASKPWYSVSNAADDRAIVRIYDEISWWGVDADTFTTDLSAITSSEIEVQINSPGGSVFEGLAIFNALRTHPARIITRVDGLAASAASFIAQAGDERIMVDSAQMMIHDAMCGCFGNAAEMRDVADFLEKQSQNIAALYAARSDGDAAHYTALMAAETWLSAAEAVDEGLADSVLTPERQDAPGNKSNTSPQAAIDLAAADAAALVDAALVEAKQDGERAAYLRNIELQRTIS